MMDESIRTRLLQANPWLREPGRLAEEFAARIPANFVPRTVAIHAPDTERAQLVVGPRQAGKSTLVWHSLREQRPEPRSLLFLNAEEERIQAWASSPSQVLTDLRQELSSVRTLFIEEAQHLADAGLFIKGLVDAGRRLSVIATGSSSYHLGARTRESLAGRARRVRLLPLSLGEILAHRTAGAPVAVKEDETKAIFQRQLVFGGYPLVWCTSEPEAQLGDLVEAFILRDASDRFRIARPDVFRRLLELAAGQIGQMANLSEWSSLVGVASSTVADYLSLMEESWIVHLLPVFSGGKRRELTQAKRVHMVDMGVRNALLGTFGADLARRPDAGALHEGWALGELLKTVPEAWGVHYWRAKGGAEVDFVLVRGERRIAIEIKGGVRASLSRSAHSFIAAYEPEAFIVATSQAGAPQRLGRTRVLYIPLHALAANVIGLLEG